MKTRKKILLIISAVCIVVGGILLSIGDVIGGKGISINLFDKDKIKLVSELEEYSINDMDYESFDSVFLDLSNCEVRIMRSENDKFGVDMKLYTYNKDNIEFSVENGQLTVKNTSDGKNMLFNFGFFNDKQQYLYIYIPDGKYDFIHVSTSNEKIIFEDIEVNGEVYAKSSNADISFSDIDASDVTAYSSNAEIDMDNITTEVLKLETSNASVVLKNVTADSLSAATSNSTVEFDGVSGVDAAVKTSNGDIILNNIYFDKSLEAKTSNSKIKTVMSGERDDYSYDISTSNGTITVDKDKCGKKYNGGKGSSKVKLTTSNADVVVQFQ